MAAVLKEEHLLQKKKEQEIKKLEDLEQNLRDSQEFENWNKEQKQLEKIKEMENQQRKKVEMELARELAMKAYQE